MKHGKVWGETELVYTDDATISIHALRIVKGGYCSEHQHSLKANEFIVLSGKLEVAVWPPGREIPDTTVLGTNERTDIPPGTWHFFRALEDTLCLEIYRGRIIDDDITRRTTGGIA